MADIINAQYDITKKSKLKIFYDSNKILIYTSLLVIIILFSSFTYYQINKENKKIMLSENYVNAKIQLGNGNKSEALIMLKKIIYENDPTYSTLCFFLILDQELISDHNEILDIFNHVLNNNKFDKEIKNLLIYKKALFSSNYVNESELLNNLSPILKGKEDSAWKPQALLLLGDYFVSKNEHVKATEFYLQILSTKNLQEGLYAHARSQLALINNEQ